MTAPVLSIAQIQTASAEYQAYKNSLTNGLAALNAVIAAGTVLYNDATFATQFPVNWAAYQTYLLSCQTHINTLISSYPTEPTLTS